jgi:hypothetical protein
MDLPTAWFKFCTSSLSEFGGQANSIPLALDALLSTALPG